MTQSALSYLRICDFTGQLAGALYGRAGIPQRWLEKLAWRKQIEDRVASLLRVRKQARKTKAQP